MPGAMRRFQAAFEKVATTGEISKLARNTLRDAIAGGRFGAMSRALVIERLWPKTDRLEVDAKVTLTDDDREAARRRLEKLIARGGAKS